MKKILIIAILALVCLVIAGTVIINHTTKETDVDSISIENIGSHISEANIVKWEEEPQQEIEYPPLPQTDMQLGALENQNKDKPKKMSDRDKRRKEWEERMKDPEFQAKMKARMKEGMARRYQPLFEYLNLSEEEEAGFTDILMRKMDGMKNLGREIFGNMHKGEISDETREKFATLNQEFADEMKNYLGDDVYDVYVQYENTQPERKEVQRINGKLAESNSTTLTLDQQDELIAAMYEDRKETDVFVMTGMQMTELPSNELLSEEGKVQQAEKLDQLNAQYIETASTILDAEQLDEFSKNITHSTERQKSFLSGERGRGRR
jgi:hypothetical protein